MVSVGVKCFGTTCIILLCFGGGLTRTKEHEFQPQNDFKGNELKLIKKGIKGIWQSIKNDKQMTNKIIDIGKSYKKTQPKTENQVLKKHDNTKPNKHRTAKALEIVHNTPKELKEHLKGQLNHDQIYENDEKKITAKEIYLIRRGKKSVC